MLALNHVSTRYRCASCVRRPAQCSSHRAAPDFDAIEIPFPERGEPALIRWEDRSAPPADTRANRRPGPIGDPAHVRHELAYRVGTSRLICEQLRSDHAAELALLLGTRASGRTLSADPRANSAPSSWTRSEENAHWLPTWIRAVAVRDRDTGRWSAAGGLQTTFVAVTRSRSRGRSCPSAGGRAWPPSSRLRAPTPPPSMSSQAGSGRRLPRSPTHLASRQEMDKAGFVFE